MGADPDELCLDILKDEVLSQLDPLFNIRIRKVRDQCQCFDCVWDVYAPLMREIQAERRERESEEASE